MKTLKYILPVLFLATSCYIYRPYTGNEIDETKAAMPGKAKAISLSDTDPVEPKDAKMKADAERKEKEIARQTKEMEMERIKREELEKKEAENKTPAIADKNGRVSADTGKSPDANTFQKSSDKQNPKVPEETTATEKDIKQKLLADRFYKISARERQYKIQVDTWEGDSLIAHKIRRPEKQLKFHKDEIDEDAILERRFSKPFSDLFTVGAYAAGAAAVLLIVL